MTLFGAWGKTGINCFVLITGYFMCKSSISLRKLLKLLVQVIFYKIIIYAIFVASGISELSPTGVINAINPVGSLSFGFVSCFIVFYLLIPYLNKLLSVLSQAMHLRIIVLLLAVYSVMPNSPRFEVSYNYVTWFCVLYLVASYIRLYGLCPNWRTRQWGVTSLLTIAVGSASVLCMSYMWHNGIMRAYNPYFFVSDSNKILSLAIAVSTFMYFKNLNISYSRVINALGAATFGVLLIHANSDTMRSWLWEDTVDCVGHYSATLPWHTLGYATASVTIIFLVCAFIDWLRAVTIEQPILDRITAMIYTTRKRVPSLKFS